MKIDPNRRLWLVASDVETMKDADAMFQRVRECMFSLDEFMRAGAEADEDSPADMERVAGLSIAIIRKVMEQYPNPSQFDADMETLRAMRTQIEVLKPHNN